MPTISYFEIPAEDFERITGFYRELFGWQIEKYSEHEDYWIINTTTATGGTGVMGGIEKRKNARPRITVFIDVPSVEEYVVKVEKLGGRVFVPKSPVPGEGYYAYCYDPEMNYFGLWEVDRSAH